MTRRPGDRSAVRRVLDLLERLGNRLPEPALLFVFATAIAAGASWLLDGHRFEVPSADGPRDLVVVSQVSGRALAALLADLVDIFTGFRPLGVVLVALLGVGVAQGSGLIQAMLRMALSRTPKRFLTPLVLAAGLMSHVGADAGYVVVIPLAAILFQAAGRHPLAGLAAGFAGVGGGFSANPLPSALDPLLQGLTQEAAQLVAPDRMVNPLCNWTFMATSCLVIIAAGWWVTDRIIEPRLASWEPSAATETAPRLSLREARGVGAAVAVAVLSTVVVVAWATPAASPLRSAAGELTAFSAPLMRGVVGLIFFAFLLPGLAYGYVAGTFRSHRDVVKSMAEAMETMGAYIVMAFFAAVFIEVFARSSLGALAAVEGARTLRALALPPALTLSGLIGLCTIANLLIGSASAKWALLAPILVPLFMQLRLAPELVQGAYRIGDSASNVVTPLNPYFPLVVSFAKKHAGVDGMGTLLVTMVPYFAVFLVSWTALLGLFWSFDIPLGIAARYTYP